MKIFKKLSAAVLVFALVISSLCTGNVRTFADETPMLISTRLQVGSKVHGFTLNLYQEDESVNGYLQVWEHDKTGAQVFMVINDDPEKAFGILFKTEPEDDTGKLHILEHASCAASEKYPGRDVFFDLVTQGFITDINAQTWHSSTIYFLGSLDEQELMNGADFYLDSAFNSLIRKEKKYFEREGWRYVINDENDPLEVTGVVYNEMKGALSDIDQYAFTNVMKYLFPGSSYGYESGGLPDRILDLTYEELIDFYDKCYHPSNCTAVVYGNVDYNIWLEEFDSYFGKFEREEFEAPAKYVPKGNYGTVTEYFPVSADTDDVTGRLLYIWDLPDELSYADFSALNMLAEYEKQLTSPLMQALNASGIGSNYGIYLDSLGDQKIFFVYVSDADTSRAEEFKSLVDEQFAAIAVSTLDQEYIDCMFESWELSEALGFNASNIGISVISAMTQAVESQDIEGMILADDYEEKVRAQFDDGKVLKLFENSIVKNDNKLLYSITPKPGLAEENEAALAKRLAEKKASMSKKELKKVIAESKAFDEWNENSGTNPETLAKLVTADPSKLDTGAPVFDTDVYEKNGVKICTAAIDSDVSYFRYSFDISNFSKTKARYLNEYINYIGLATTNRTQEQVSNDFKRYLGGLTTEISMQVIDGKNVPSLVISFYAFNDNLDKALDLVFDMFYNTDLENAYNVSTIAQYSAYFASQYSDPSAVDDMLKDAVAAYTDPAYALSWKLKGISRYDFLTKALSSEENFAKLISGMDSVRKKVVKRQNAVISIVGSKESQKSSVKAMLARLPKKNKTYKTGSITDINPKYQNIAIEMNTQAAFTRSGYTPATYDLKTTAAEIVALAIMDDVMYLPEFRYALGAYGVNCGVNRDGLLQTRLYRSPEFTNSLKRIAETPDELEAILPLITDEDLDGYKLPKISDLVIPEGEWNMAAEALRSLAAGQDTVRRYEVAKAIQAVTVEDIAAALPAIREAYEKMRTVVIGTSEEIAANREFFDKIYRLK